MSDDLGLFADGSGERPVRNRRQMRQEREKFQRRRRRRSVTALAGLFVLLVVGGGVLYGASQILQIGMYDDYEGPGSGQAVVQVKSGDSISSIGQTLAKQDVVASAKAFTKAAENNRRLDDVQPGFYLMKTRMSGAAAVEHMLSPSAKVGRLEVRGGMRLEDLVGGQNPGILTQLAKVGCAGGAQCVTPEQMQQVASTADLASLGVPQWAIEPASRAEPLRRLEGLIMPGIYDVKPGGNAEELLRQVVSTSAAQLEVAGLPQAAQGSGMSPYEVLTVASLVQSEGINKDFPRVARVIYNRLNPPAMKLGFDSTINYPLDKPTLLTKSEDRARPGPYNTYQNFGLPPTPISSASKEAIKAAEKPEAGEWRFFVKCFKDGTSCFADTPEQHQAFIREAQQRGAF